MQACEYLCAFCCIVYYPSQEKESTSRIGSWETLPSADNVYAEISRNGEQKHVRYIYREGGLSKWDYCIHRIKALLSKLNCCAPSIYYSYGNEALKESGYVTWIGNTTIKFPEKISVSYDDNSTITKVAILMQQHHDETALDG